MSYISRVIAITKGLQETDGMCVKKSTVIIHTSIQKCYVRSMLTDLLDIVCIHQRAIHYKITEDVYWWARGKHASAIRPNKALLFWPFC